MAGEAAGQRVMATTAPLVAFTNARGSTAKMESGVPAAAHTLSYSSRCGSTTVRSGTV